MDWRLLLFALVTSVAGNIRGPHHPRGRVIRHTHHRPGHAVKITNDPDLLHDKQHIAEDLNELAIQIDTSNMTPEELEFHYFRLHDLDNNTKLDGLEILQAIQHVLEEDEEVHEEDDLEEGMRRGISHSSDELREQDFDYFIELIDQVLAEDDLDNDGFLSYVEYAVGRQRDRVRGTKSPQSQNK